MDGVSSAAAPNVRADAPEHAPAAPNVRPDAPEDAPAAAAAAAGNQTCVQADAKREGAAGNQTCVQADAKREGAGQQTRVEADARREGAIAAPVLGIGASQYAGALPFPHAVIDDFLPPTLALELQREILALPDALYHQIRTPFEDKLLLPKQLLPARVVALLQTLESDAFIRQLERLSGGRRIIVDAHRHYWGVHKYAHGERLDIHVDAGLHPFSKHRKFMTLAIYLSHEWLPEEYGGELELWSGDDASLEEPRVDGPVVRIAPTFNRAVLFTNTDRAWHGNPSRTRSKGDARRIICTLSYLTADSSPDFRNRRERAYFAAPRGQSDASSDIRHSRAACGSAASAIKPTLTVPNHP
jgi:hypothetical protein